MAYNPRSRFPQRDVSATVKADYQQIGNPDAPATEKQVEFLTSLGNTRDCGMSVEEFGFMLGAWKEAGVLTKGFVSEQIEAFKAYPKRATAAAAPGYYTLDGEHYVVVKTKDGARTYAKHLTKSEAGKFSWEYAPGLGAKMAHMTPLTLEEAAAWGHLHGICMICCRPLTDSKSVLNGIGPVCAKKVTR